MSIATILSIVSALLGIAKWFISYSEQKKWIEIGESRAILKGLEDCEQVIKDAREARQAVRDQHIRDPDSIMRDDDFKRPD
jgi:hypothetical protein